jgi:hypothetical protein
MSTMTWALAQIDQPPTTAEVWAESLICIAAIAAVVAIIWRVSR